MRMCIDIYIYTYINIYIYTEYVYIYTYYLSIYGLLQYVGGQLYIYKSCWLYLYYIVPMDSNTFWEGLGYFHGLVLFGGTLLIISKDSDWGSKQSNSFTPKMVTNHKTGLW